MPWLQIEGISVDFPHEPYECQVEYMRKNILALKGGHNALLESPTGTGKTLCLLCSTLAFQAHMHKAMKRAGVVLEYMPGASLAGAKAEVSSSATEVKKEEVRAPTIIYASRTHSQITQVVRELRTTSYKVKMTVLASRDQLCVDHKISKLRGNALNFACNRKNSSAISCTYKRNLDQYKVAASDGVSHPTFDIEELVNIVGKQDKVCPYFYTRDEAKDAELVLLPYNYLFDPEVRRTLSVNFNQAIVILDEGHNIEKVAADAASFSFTTTTVAQCIMELQNCLRATETANPEDGDRSGDPRGSWRGLADSDCPPPASDAVTHLLRALFDVERGVDSVPLGKFLGSTPSCALVGSWMADLFERAGIVHEKSGYYIDQLRVAGKFLMKKSMDALNGDGNSSINVSIPEPKLLSMSNHLARVFRSENKQANLARSLDYKVFIREEDPKESSKPTYGNRPGLLGAAKPSSTKKRAVNFWAFTSGIAMEELRALGVRTFVITSGTLSPLDAFSEDMRIPFQVRLENPHVIDGSQLWVGALSTGASKKRLNSSYDNRETDEYKDELGLSVLQICQTMYGRAGQQQVPQGAELRGGVLLFFPSYKAMDSAIARWTHSGLLDALRNYGGPIVVEPRAAAGGKAAPMPAAFTGATDKKRLRSTSSDPFENPSVLNPKDDDEDSGENGDTMIKGIVSELEAALASHSRCLVMAVCRGKVSEGIDFKDERGRVVIITGIPFAPTMDPWVRLKQDFLDEQCGRPSASTSAAATALNNRPPGNAMASYGSIVRVGQAVVSTSIPARSSCPPPQPPAPAAAFVSAKPLTGAEQPQPQPPTPRPKGGLDGRSWYMQSASRAVNQAIGRVIRHRHDWGCIFLLDDRFPQGQQRSQLSSWVRPRTQVFSDYSSSLYSFRAFISVAMARPELNPAKILYRNDVNTVVDVKPPTFHIKPKPDGSEALDGITRQVLLKASSLPGVAGGEGYANYINPDLLLTQNVEVCPHPAAAAAALGRSSRRSDIDVPRRACDEENADLESIFNLAEARPSQSGPSTAAPRVADIFSRQHKVVSASSSSTKVAPSSTPLLHQLHQHMRRDSAPEAQRLQRPTPTPTPTPSSEGQKPANAALLEHKTNLFRAVVTSVQSALTEERFISFKLLCKRVQESRIGSVPAVKDFAEKLKGVFADVAETVARPLMLRLSILVDSNEMLQAVFASSVASVLNNMRFDKEKQRERELELAEQKRKAEAAAAAEARKKARTGPSSAIAGTKGNPSTQTVVVLAEDGLTPLMQTSYSNFISKKPAASSGARSMPPSQRPSMLSQPSSQPSQRALGNLQSSSKSSTLQCGVCFADSQHSPATAATVYLAARCGHICCKQCWGQLLLRKLPCPTCRAPINQIQLTKVLLK